MRRTILVWSASADGNDRVFPRILDMYVKPGSIVADVTYGKGVFWRNVADDRYDLRASDIQGGVDCRVLPYGDGEIDCVVLDPPYMHSPGGTAHRSHTPFEDHYRNNGSGNRTNSKYHEAVLDLYLDAGRGGAQGLARARRSHRQVSGRGLLEPPKVHPRRDNAGVQRRWDSSRRICSSWCEITGPA